MKIQLTTSTAAGGRRGRGLTSFGRNNSYNPITALGSDLYGYFDARRLDSLTLDNGFVSEQRCLITNYAVAQASSPAQPFYDPTGFGGDPSINFDGIDDCLVASNHPYPIAPTQYEVWLLTAQLSPVEETTQRYAFGQGTGTVSGATLSRTSSGTVNRVRGTAGNGTTSIINNNNNVEFSTRHLLRLKYNTTGIQTIIDGVTTPETAGSPSTTNLRFRFGAFINTLPGNFYLGRHAACLITNPLSGSKEADLVTWLMNRRRV